LQHLSHSGGVVVLCGMPQPEVTDLVEAARQHVLEEAAHEFVAAQAAGSLPAGLAFLVLDADRLVVEADDPCVGESDAKDVAGEVVEYGLLTGAPGGNVEDPAGAPRNVSTTLMHPGSSFRLVSDHLSPPSVSCLHRASGQPRLRAEGD